MKNSKNRIEATEEDTAEKLTVIETPMFYKDGDQMSLGAALTRGYILRSYVDDNSVVINGLELPIDAAVSARLINQEAANYIRESVQGRSTAAPFTRVDAQEPEEATEGPTAKTLEALALFFTNPTPENKRAAIEAIQSH